MKFWQLVMVSSTLASAVPAFAQMAPAPESRAEVETRLRERLGKFDANHDGVVTREEIMAYTATRIKVHEGDEFVKMDANHDGMISRAEFDDYHSKMRGMMRGDGMGGDRVMMMHGDTDAPGVATMMMRRERIEGAPGTTPPGMGRPPRMRVMTMDGRDGEMTMGEGTDRMVIADEVKRAQARFDLMDTNHDGTVTPEERRAYRALHAGRPAMSD